MKQSALAEKARKEAEDARQKTSWVIEQARKAFVTSVLAEVDDLQSRAQYAKAGDFLAALIGVARDKNGRIAPDLIGPLMPRMAQQYIVAGAMPFGDQAANEGQQTRLRLDRPGKYEAETNEDRDEIDVIDRDTGLRYGHFRMESGRVDAKARHFVSRDGADMILVRRGSGLYVWHKGRKCRPIRARSRLEAPTALFLCL